MGEEARPPHNEIGWVPGSGMVGKAVGLEGESSPSCCWRVGSIVAVSGLQSSAARGIFPDQGLNLCLLR